MSTQDMEDAFMTRYNLTEIVDVQQRHEGRATNDPPFWNGLGRHPSRTPRVVIVHLSYKRKRRPKASKIAPPTSSP